MLLPLANLRVVVTRAVHQAEELAGPLRELGAAVLLVPTIGIGPPSDPKKLKSAAQNCDSYDWIVFTSANAVAAFAAELKTASEIKPRVAAVGAATADIAEQYGFRVMLSPSKYVAEELVAAFEAKELSGARILIPSAAVTRDVVAPALRQRGATVDVVEAYRNVLPETAEQIARRVFQPPYPDWVTFTSSSAVDNLVRIIGTEPLRHVRVATIGPVTSETVRKLGLNVAAEANVHSVRGLVEAIATLAGMLP